MYTAYIRHDGVGRTRPEDHDPKTGRWTFGRKRYAYTDSEGKEQLTKIGQARYERERKANLAKPKQKRAEDEGLRDPDRWVREDISNAGNITSSLRTTLESAQRISNQIDTMSKSKNKRLDLRELSDAELRTRIERERMERQYNEYFNSPQEKKGKKVVDAILGYGIPVVMLAGGVVSLIGGINALKTGKTDK